MEETFDFLENLKTAINSELLFIICEYLDQYSNMRLSDLLDIPDLRAFNSTGGLKASNPSIQKRTKYSVVELEDLKKLTIWPDYHVGINIESSPDDTFDPNADGFRKFKNFGGHKLILTDSESACILNSDYKDILNKIQIIKFEGLLEIRLFGCIRLTNILKVIADTSCLFNIGLENILCQEFDHIGFKKMFAKLKYVKLINRSYVYFIKTCKRHRDESDNKRLIKIFPESVEDMDISIYNFNQIYRDGSQLPTGIKKIHITLMDDADFKFAGTKYLPNCITTLMITTLKNRPLDLEHQIPDNLEALIINTYKPLLINLGVLPPSLKYLYIDSPSGVHINILSSNLVSVKLCIDRHQQNGFPKLDLSPESHPDLKQLFLTTTDDMEINRESVPIGITELYINKYSNKIAKLRSLPVFDRERYGKCRVIIGGTTAENAETIERFQIPVTVMSILSED